MQIGEFISGRYYVLCICEGRAEEDLINYLLENDLLIFKRQDLLFEKITRTRAVKKIQEEFLSLYFEKPVIIIRIVDSKNEKFKLDAVYEDRYEDKVFNIITRPEIEILIVIKNGDYGRYSRKHKSKNKPSEFCQAEYGIKNIKSKGRFICEFEDVEQILDAIKTYKSLTNYKELSLSDLLNKDL